MKEFKSTSNWIRHGIEGIIFMQLLRYFAWLCSELKVKTIPFNMLADLQDESQNSFIGGLLVFMIGVALMALLVEWIETKVSEGTDISVPDIIMSAVVGGLWFAVPLEDSLIATIIAGVLLIASAWYLLKKK
jgi:phosphate starvation-inducible membrane PsiE